MMDLKKLAEHAQGESIHAQVARACLIEIERLQAETIKIEAVSDARWDELATLRTWKTPDYSPAQLANFHESCIAPPKLFIEWHFLPDVPEPEPTEDHVFVRACYEYNGTEYVDEMQYYAGDDDPGFFDDCDTEYTTVRAWHYLPSQAPPKPEGELPAIELAPEPEDALNELEKAAISYFGLDYAESDEEGAGWFCYQDGHDVRDYYPGTSCECLSDVVEWYAGREKEPQKCPKCGGRRIVPAHRQISNFDLDYQSLEDLGIHIPNGGEREIESEQHIGVHWCADCKHIFDSWIESNMKMAVEKCPDCAGKVAQYCDAVVEVVQPDPEPFVSGVGEEIDEIWINAHDLTVRAHVCVDCHKVLKAWIVRPEVKDGK